jgi:tight adherence protein B
MSACFRSGYSLLQTFKHLAMEAKGPLCPLFQRAASDLETGRTASDALRHLREESTLREFAFLTAALEIQHQTGGSMQSIIDSACDSVEGELALRRSLRVQTAQAKLSARVVAVMPLILIAAFSLISPDFLSPFFESVFGYVLLGIAIAMQVECLLKVPLCIWRIGGGKWIHDVTKGRGLE